MGVGFVKQTMKELVPGTMLKVRGVNSVVLRSIDESGNVQRCGQLGEILLVVDNQPSQFQQRTLCVLDAAGDLLCTMFDNDRLVCSKFDHIPGEN